MSIGYLRSDYHSAVLENESTCYNIGKNSGTLFVSEETLVLVSANCLIKLNNDTFWQPIYTDNDYFVFHRKITTICFKKNDGDGNIEIWAEGNIKR